MKKPLSQNKDWLSFAEAVRSEFPKCGFQAELIAACGGAEDIAWAIYFHHGAESMAWLEASIPFLGDARPGDLIQQGKADRVRECLWRTP